MNTASTLIKRLGTVGSDLPNDLARKIVALGSEATPLLVSVLDHGPVAEPCSECSDQHDAFLEPAVWAMLHAVDLLTELRDPAAIEAMLKVVARTSSDEAIHDKIVERLPDFGAVALEPILAALARTTADTERAESLCCILSVLGVRDERILRALLNLLDVKPRAAAMYLADYGDPAACPALFAAIDAFRPEAESLVKRSDLPELIDAYESLDGELPAGVKARVSAWLRG